jgi:hypothetical protein
MSNAVDYRDRQIDVLAFDGVHLAGEHLALQRLVAPGESGKAIAGVARLAQTFMIRLLTGLGSIPYLEEEGTDFIPAFRRGEVRTSLEAEQVFQSAMVDLKRQFLAEETDDQPADEKLQSVELLSVAHFADRVVYRIRIRNQAGGEITTLLPLTAVLQPESLV